MNEETNIEQPHPVHQTGFNEAKRDILGIVNDLGTATSMEIALITSRSSSAASMCLYRYHGQGLLSRSTLRGRTKIYNLTLKGRARLDWLVRSTEN